MLREREREKERERERDREREGERVREKKESLAAHAALEGLVCEATPKWTNYPSSKL